MDDVAYAELLLSSLLIEVVLLLHLQSECKKNDRIQTIERPFCHGRLVSDASYFSYDTL
jgi:hypothetical protein